MENRSAPVISLGEWIITFIVLAIPLVNIIMLFVWGFSSGTNPSKQNFCRAALILYGPWLKDDVPTAPSNLAFDADLKQRDPRWGLRRVEDFAAAGAERGFRLETMQAMPANNLMLLLRRS